jgi:CelD/BcsL family acetyltransferase involved in cellulose biosynthesis
MQLNCASETDRTKSQQAALRVVVCQDWDHLSELRPAWNELAKRSPTNEIFLTYEFLRSWEASKTRECRPCLIVAFRGSELAGIAPLMHAERHVPGLRLTTLEFLGTPANDYSDFLYEDPQTLAVLWESTQRLAGDVDLLYLQEIRQSSPTCDFLRLQKVTMRQSETCWSVELPARPDAPLADHIKAPGFRPRVVRRLEKEGALTLEAHHEFEAIREHLPVLFEQHIQRWRELDKVSNFVYPAYRRQYENISRDLSQEHKAVLILMRLNGAPIASLWGFEYERKLTVYSIAFDVAYRKFYCGLVFLAKVVQSLKAQGIDRVDFGRGAETFKSYFADVQMSNFEFLWPRTMKAKLAMSSFLTVRDWVMAHDKVKALISRCGYRGDTVGAASGE